MESSSYKVISTSDDYLEHYGVKGMKWGVVHDEEEKRRRERVALDPQKSPTGPYRSKLESDRVTANKTGMTVERTRRTPHGDITIQTHPSSQPDYKQIFEETVGDTLRENAMKGAREGFKESVKETSAQIQEGLGAAFNINTTPEARAAYLDAYNEVDEAIDTIKDIELRELEERNPVAGKTLRAVDNFIESFTSFAVDFTKSVNKIIGDIMSWGKKLFGG